MHFNHLKIIGFKSFAEPADFTIHEGLSGIVGPNGCGKSNIVEAMRWLMGESSAKSMRGGELDDVIFAGTAERPQRNFAEVTLTIDNSDGTIESYANEAQIEISRRLDRGKGSSYRINGKPVRGRDVQLFFADLGTGARAHGIVSQGKVGSLINAKPSDRRGLIEEAANTKGLQHRRHEANLRLNTAERNLIRVDDVIEQMNEQKSALAKQARQAARYRSINDRIRTAEAQLLHTRYRIESDELEAAKTAYRQCERQTADATQATSDAEKIRTAAADALPPLRQQHAALTAEKQRLDLALTEIDNERARLKRQSDELATRHAQTDADIVREKQLESDASTALDRLKAEEAEIASADADTEPQLHTAQEQRAKCRDDANKCEVRLAEITATIHAVERDQTRLENERDTLNARLNETKTRLENLDLPALIADKTAAEKHLADAEKAVEFTSQNRQKASDKAAAITETAQKHINDANHATSAHQRITSEIEALTSLLVEQDASDTANPVSSMMTIRDNMDEAIAAALADSLSAPIGDGKNGYWRDDMQARTDIKPPQNTKPLTDYIDAPPALTASLSAVGVAKNSADALRLQPHLTPGQMLTTPQGGLWRWDGFVLPQGATAGAAQRLRHEARLKELNAKIDGAAKKAENAKSQAEASKAEQTKADTAIALAREEETQARNHLLEATRQFEQAQGALRAGEAQSANLTADQKEAETALAGVLDALKTRTSPDGMQAELEECRAETEAARQRLAEAMSAENIITQAREMRAQKRESITRDREHWQRNYDGAQGRLNELTTRQQRLAEEIAELKAQPDLLTAKAEEISTSLAKSESAVREAGDALATAETALAKADTSKRELESALATTREAMIRQEGEVAVATRALEETAQRIKDRLDATPEELPEIAGASEDSASRDSLSALESRLERLIRERDNIGPVNLRAELEMEETETRITSLSAERDDLTQAIASLRQAISELNREGRTRLLRSFTEVNEHFNSLFKTLFNGGSATLELTDEGDPLEAGLEILASPPGKKLQAMSLLSGGEQALTALALIFAVFLTNPAPICVLDEVDAPLDDRNVARFCQMIEKIADDTNTRFIIVTHHRLTMARMERLFGVTMEQKGVSQIVSVDLQTAEKYKQSA